MNPEAKQVNSTLFKRSMDQYAPDMLYINASSIAFVEPVISGSKIETIIKQADTQDTNYSLAACRTEEIARLIDEKAGDYRVF